MAGRSLRTTERFDYKIYSTTGEKVPCGVPRDEMAAEAKTAGILAGLLFQIQEVIEDVADLSVLGLTDLKKNHDELKELRVNIVQVSFELKSLKNVEKLDNEQIISDVLSVAKANLAKLKCAISAKEAKADKKEAVKEAAQIEDRRFVFDTVLDEIVIIGDSLNNKYDISDDENITVDIILKRKEMKEKYASERDRLKTLVDRLLDFTDVQFHGKQLVINAQLLKVKRVDELRDEFEDKLLMDLELYDLTDQKLKLATLTTIDIGRFSGMLERGDDFYTFKTKFMNAYKNHPRNLKVEWLKNNHLEGNAKDCVGSLDDMERIWARLKDNFGNTEQLLLYHFSKINKIGHLSKQKSLSSKKFYVQNLINAMQDVKNLAVEHNLLGELSYGPQLDKIVALLDNYLQSAWFKAITVQNVPKPNRWDRMVTFLESQLSILQARAAAAESIELLSLSNTLGLKKGDGKDSKTSPKHERKFGSSSVNYAQKEMCSLCDEVHPNANIGFFQCRKFLVMPIKKRCEHVRKKKLCLQCLDSSTKWNDSDHSCSDKWVCCDKSHERYEKKLHFLVCEFHTENEGNKKLFEEFKKEVLKDEWQKKIFKDKPSYISRNSTFLKKKGDFCLEEKGKDDDVIDTTSAGPAVFLLQPVPFNNKVFNFMYDSGCGSFVCRKAALDQLPDDCKENLIKGPIVIKGVGNNQVVSQYGHYSVKFPTYTGKYARFNGVSLDVITGPMPSYPVREASKSIVESYVSQGGKEGDLPSIPVLVGGETDFLLGIQYNYFQPRLIHILPSGLAIYESLFHGVDGTRGCVGGPHPYFLQCEQQFAEYNNDVNFRTFLTRQLELFRNGLRVCLDYDVLDAGHRLLADSVGVNAVAPNQCDQVDVSTIAEKGSNSKAEDSDDSHTMIVQIANKLESVPSSDQVSSLHVCNIAVVDEENLEQEPIVLSLSKIRKAIDADQTGSTIEYRCIKCRGCSNCKNGERIEKVSLKEEYEQSIIDASVTVDIDHGISSAILPFTSNPHEKLSANKEVALKVYNQQLRKLNKNSEEKKNVLDSEQKLQDAQYVDYVENLNPSEKQLLSAPGVCHYLPWRVVHNENSISTATRLVFDASAITSSGFSLNDILPKGINQLNSLLEIFLRWRTWPVAMHTDARKMYNTIKLHPEFWRFQLYLWEPLLDSSKEPVSKVIKTLIYGVRPSGNQAQVALRKTAEKQKDKYPDGAESVINDTYADDCATGTISHENADNLASEITDLIAGGGFTLKGFTVSGKPPIPSLSKDGISINVAGIKWLPEEDKIQLGIGPLNFNKKCRGKKQGMQNKIPEKLTKRICLSKTAEIFDFSGIILPIISGFKIDIHNLHMLSLGWDDELPTAEREKWVKNFELMESITDLSWQRAVIPSDAISLEMELIGAGDASEKIACSACYVRFQCRDNSYSCQLLFAKSKIIEEGTSVPRAELKAATLNTHTVQIVKRSLKERVVGSIYVLDSEIVLHWITSQTKPLKPLVRNNVIEISRYTDVSEWFHVESSANPVDVATRKGATLDDVQIDSEFQKGKSWMNKHLDELTGTVLKNVEDVKLKSHQIAEMKKEQIKPESDLCRSDYHLLLPSNESDTVVVMENSIVYLSTDLSITIGERLKFSKYLINPNKFDFTKVVKILALVIRVAKFWLSKIERCLQRFSASDPTDSQQDGVIELDQSTSSLFAILTDDDIQQSKNYFFMKATEELKSFVHPKHYEKFAEEKDDILYFVGRVTNSDFSFAGDFTEKMLDLTNKSFVVPIVDAHSPLAYSIVNDVHWNDPDAKHRGVETTIRAVMSIAYILNVRELAKLFRKKCQRCRYILKKTVEVLMGPKSKFNLCIAPPFYITQVDICGPFTSYSTHNKRSTKKVWILVFVCSTTGCTNMKIMEQCDTVQFLLAFVRFAYELGYPKKLLIDEGSQLISGCENIVLNMSNLKGQMNREYGIEFDTCPVGGHNFHGRVERKIRSIRDVMDRSVKGYRLSVLEWETLCSEISNTVNNMPVAIGNETEDLENLDIITPNRLRLARNNNRSPVGPLEVTSKIDRLLRLRHDAFEAWWEAWLVSTLPKLVPQPKWFRSDSNLQKGDIILFNKSEASLIGEYKYGIVEEVRISTDNQIRSVLVKYKNANENVFRTTVRAVRTLIVIHRVDEIDIMEEIGAATYTA